MKKFPTLHVVCCMLRVACSRISRGVPLVLLLASLTAPAAEQATARYRGSGKADPIRIANVHLTNSPAAGQSAIALDLAWDHSWREAWEVPEQACALFYADDKHNRPQDQKWEEKPPIKLENWDAAWVFAKFRVPGGGLSSSGGSAAANWRHATLSPLAADHAKPAGAALDVGLDDNPAAGGAAAKRGLGVFVYRDSIGNGSNAWKGLALRWLHGADGVSDPAAAELRVFGIKMVYVPKGAFWAGDGAVPDPEAKFLPDLTGPGAGGEPWPLRGNCFWRTWDISAQFQAGDTSDPLRIESEDALTLGGTSTANLGNHNSWGRQLAEDFSTWVTQPLPARFPKGVAAFYCMRSELTEGAYVEFLNTLTYEQQKAHTRGEPEAPPDSPVGTKCLGHTSVVIAVPGRQRVEERVSRGDGVIATVNRLDTPAVYRTEAPYTACGHMGVRDGIDFAGWAGLRPMTELEYEKACRGPVKPIPDEYAWGTKDIANGKEPVSGYEVRNIGKPDEHVVCVRGDGQCNVAWWGTLGRPNHPVDESAEAPEPAATNRPAEVPAGNGPPGRKPTTVIDDEPDHDTGGPRGTSTNPYREFLGPLRAEVFAGPTTQRLSAGASYWGILEMSGNLWEMTITVGSKAGRRFEGTHGNGSLEPSPGWHLPSWESASNDRAFRGRGGGCGTWIVDRVKETLRTSDRASVLGLERDNGLPVTGLRCVRTAPQ